MKKFTTLAALLLAASLVSAGTITFTGAVEDSATATQVSDWLTPATAKTLDGDGDNIYGTHGRINFGDALVPDMAFIGSGAQITNAAYKQIDDANVPAGKNTAGIALSSLPGDRAYTFGINGLTGSDNTLRLGLMQNVLSAGENAADVGKVVTVTKVGAPTETLSFTLGDGGVTAGDGFLDMYFLDLTGVSNGDQYDIFVTDNGQSGYVSGVSLDIVVPEPATMSLLALGGIAMLKRRKK